MTFKQKFLPGKVNEILELGNDFRTWVRCYLQNNLQRPTSILKFKTHRSFKACPLHVKYKLCTKPEGQWEEAVALTEKGKR
jgi:hypothetical protein